jgi:Putative lumazine-binding
MIETAPRSDEPASGATHDAIAARLQSYIDAARTGDGARMRNTFLETAHIRGSYGGKPVAWTVSDFCDVIDKGGPAADLTSRIVTIDHSGTAAMARVEAENWRGTRYTDFFVLLEIDTDWRIASKVFFAHSRA